MLIYGAETNEPVASKDTEKDSAETEIKAKEVKLDELETVNAMEGGKEITIRGCLEG